MSDLQQPRCVSCGRNSSEVPLIALEYQGSKYWICPQDFPVLIHMPQELAGKLPGVERLTPNEH